MLSPYVRICSEVDKAHVRLAAAKGIVRLSRYHHTHIIPDLTEKTSLVVQVGLSSLSMGTVFYVIIEEKLGGC
jgi:hypothetical protein